MSICIMKRIICFALESAGSSSRSDAGDTGAQPGRDPSSSDDTANGCVPPRSSGRDR